MMDRIFKDDFGLIESASIWQEGHGLFRTTVPVISCKANDSNLHSVNFDTSWLRVPKSPPPLSKSKPDVNK